MRTNIEAVLTPIWLLALSILVTIYLAWGFYYFDVDWMHLLNYVVIGKSDLWHNFNVLMRYLTFPWVLGWAVWPCLIFRRRRVVLSIFMMSSGSFIWFRSLLSYWLIQL